MPVKKKDKKIKIKVMRGARPSKQRKEKKANVKQTVNVYTTSTEPYRTDFKDQYRYGLGYGEREQTPFQPVFNYIQPPVQQPIPSMTSSSEIKKVEVEAKPKRTYTKKPVAIGVAVTEGGYKTDFTPSESEGFRQPTRQEESEVLARAKIREIERELRRQPSDNEFLSGNLSPVVTKPRGKPKGTSNKEAQFTQPIGQTDIMSFFGKTSSKE